ncbi:MAG: hypothetical protein IKS48_00350 [Eubacterium sp.]|nr:hypothetical protein [Eubacterium sp.]
MKLYDPKFVHFEWSDKLNGKYCFVADYIGDLIKSVNENNTSEYGKVSKADEYSTSPFYCDPEGDVSRDILYTFAYYDPNYDVKYAYWEMGYEIYYKLKDKNCDWEKVSDNTNFLYVIDDPDYEFKIDDDFAELREAYKQGKTIQHMNLEGDWVDCDVPGFSANHSYRIKPEEKKVQKSLSNPDLYRPFKDTDELIAYWEKHYGNGNRPEHTMPLIWIKGKDTGNVYLINGYEEGKCVYISADWWFDMEELFEQFKFLDGRPCGLC